MGLVVHSFDRRSIEIDLRVDYKQRVIGVEHIIVDADSVEILLEETLEEHILFLKSSLLLLNRQFVQEHLVVSLIEVVEELELVVFLLLDSFDSLHCDVGDVFLHRDLLLLVEGEHLLFLGL